MNNDDPIKSKIIYWEPTANWAIGCLIHWAIYTAIVTIKDHSTEYAKCSINAKFENERILTVKGGYEGTKNDKEWYTDNIILTMLWCSCCTFNGNV